MRTNRFNRHRKRMIAVCLVLSAFIFAIADFLLAKKFIRSWTSTNVVHYRTTHTYYHHTLRKKIDCEASWGEARYRIFTNSLGFRDHAVREVLPRNERKRILLMGDSFTEGIGMPYVDTFAGMLAARSANGAPEILNAGVVSYSPKLHLLKLQFLTEVLNLRFDELITFIDISDTQDEIVYESFNPGLELLTESADNKEGMDIEYAISIVQEYFKRNSLVGNVLLKKHVVDQMGETNSALFVDFYKERDQWVYDDEIFERWGRKGLDLAKTNMIRIVDLCREQQIRMSIVVYPWPSTLRKGHAVTRYTTYWQQFAIDHQIEFVDLTPTFIELGGSRDVIDAYYIYNDCHWNAKGHEIVADKLAASLITN